MIHGRATPEAQALDEALPPGWHVTAYETEEGSNPGAKGFPHPPSEYERGRSPCYVEIVRTGRKVEYSRRRGEYEEADEPQWWVYRHCPSPTGMHDLDATTSAHDGREAARIAARFADGASSQDVGGRNDFRRKDDFSFGNWR